MSATYPFGLPGGPAFPITIPGAGGLKYGMALRDYFATAALQGYIAAGIPSDSSYDDIANKAYRAADAMLRERR